MLAHAVHLADGGAGLQQCLVDLLLVRQGQALGGQGQQGRATAGQQEDDAVVFIEVADQFQHALGHGQAGGIGDRVGGFDHLDLLAVGAVAVTGDDQAGDFALPAFLDHFGHGGCGLAGADDDDPAATVGGQVGFEDLTGVGGGDGCVEQFAEKFLRIDRHGRLPIIVVLQNQKRPWNCLRAGRTRGGCCSMPPLGLWSQVQRRWLLRGQAPLLHAQL
ncbi:hypothetical protein D9M71_483520 [compost metagenome]